MYAMRNSTADRPPISTVGIALTHKLACTHSHANACTRVYSPARTQLPPTALASSPNPPVRRKISSSVHGEMSIDLPLTARLDTGHSVPSVMYASHADIVRTRGRARTSFLIDADVACARPDTAGGAVNTPSFINSFIRSPIHSLRSRLAGRERGSERR